MTNEVQRALLRKFFSAYFHEDWLCDAESVEEVIVDYVRGATLVEARMLGESILGYSRDFATDLQLEDNLVNNLGCYYRPSFEGLSAKVWLEGIADQLFREKR